MKNGPTKFIPSTGPIKGYITLQFSLTLLTTALFLVWRIFSIFILMRNAGLVLPYLFQHHNGTVLSTGQCANVIRLDESNAAISNLKRVDDPIDLGLSVTKLEEFGKNVSQFLEENQIYLAGGGNYIIWDDNERGLRGVRITCFATDVSCIHK